jgi:hypothetical protein
MSIEKCNTCKMPFSDSGDEYAVVHQSLKNRKFLATLDEDGNVLAECCELCAQEVMEMSDDESPQYAL